MEKIFEDVKTLVVSNDLLFTQDDISFESTFDELGFDDLDIADLIISVEDFYNIQFSDDEYDSFEDIKGLCELISERLKKDFE